MYSYSYFNTAKVILQEYKGDVPFAAWLREFFKRDKKFGSRDRKQIAHLCYCYFRVAKALSHLDVDQSITWSLFLCSQNQNKLLEGLDPNLNASAQLSTEEKLHLAKDVGIQIENIFPWGDEISDEIDHAVFSESFLIQPDLFLRIRPGNQQQVLTAIQSSGISFETAGLSCIRLSNTTKVDELIKLDRDAVVQDLNSQKTLNALTDLLEKNKKMKAWDCCAASGGKSLLLLDQCINVQLLATDIRSSILHNLQKRFERAGIKSFRSKVHDASKEVMPERFDLVICDAPCSGSGTWSRTPEQLYFFEEKKIEHYSSLQKRIAANVSKSIRPGGFLVYITCSVFEKENEGVVQYIKEQTGLRHIESRYLIGYKQKADTLFTALFQL